MFRRDATLLTMPARGYATAAAADVAADAADAADARLFSAAAHATPTPPPTLTLPSADARYATHAITAPISPLYIIDEVHFFTFSAAFETL
jgi:hypothetical protein